MATRPSSIGNLPTIFTAILAAAFGIRIATQSGDDLSRDSARVGAGQRDESDDRSDGWKLKAGRDGSLLDLVRAKPAASAPHQHHPFLQPLADFTGRSLEDFVFDDNKYHVKPLASSANVSGSQILDGPGKVIRNLIRQFIAATEPCCEEHGLISRMQRTLASLLAPLAEEPGKPQPIQRFLAAQDLSCHFLISTVPSPIDPKQADGFDLWIEALQRAVAYPPSTSERLEGANSYVLDSYWLPWDRYSNNEEGIKEAFKSLPGLLLFRADQKPGWRGKTDILFVFLVGETPIAGVRKEAFTAALDFVGQCQQVIPMPQCGDSTLKILGPAYSGSQKSLEKVLADWCQRWRQAEQSIREKANGPQFGFDVISTGTALDTKDFKDSVESAIPGQITVKLKSTLQNDQVVLEDLFRHISRLHDQASSRKAIKIVNLIEYSTSFGSKLSSAGTQSLSSRIQKNSTECNKPDFIFVDAPFPAHIAEVHQRRDKQQRLERQGLPQFGGPTSQLRTPILRDSAKGGVIPPLGGEMTTELEDLALAQLFSVLKTEKPDYVLIGATDTRDVVFLAEIVRNNLPGAQILLTSSHLLFLHQQYRKHLVGSIVASTYPMAPDTAVWGIIDPHVDSTATNRETMFVHPDAQGFYNATLFHLGKESGLLDYGTPHDFRVKSCQTDRQKLDRNLPGTWISRIGSGEFLPVQFFPARKAESEGDVYLRNRSAKPTTLRSCSSPLKVVPWYWIGLNFALAFLIAVYLISVGKVVLRVAQSDVPTSDADSGLSGRKRRGWTRWWLDRFGDSKLAAGDMDSRIAFASWRAMATLIPGIVANYIASIWAVSVSPDSVQWHVIFGCIFTLEFGLSASLAFVGLLMHFLAPFAQPSRKEAVLLIVLIALIARAMIALQCFPTSPCVADFNGPRVTSLFSGINPAIPLILLGIPAIWWPLWRLTRIDAMLTGRDPLTLPEGSCRIDGSRIDTSGIVSPNFGRRFRSLAWPLSAGFLCIGWIFRDISCRWLPTPDGATLDDLAFRTLAGLSAVIVFEIIDFLWLWRRLESVHNRIANLPMQAAFAHLPPTVVDEFGKFFVRIGADRELNAWERQQWMAVRKLGGYQRLPPGLLSVRQSDVRRQLLKVKGTPRKIASVLYEYLSSYVWPARTYDDDLHAASDRARPSELSDKKSIDTWNRAVESFLALLIFVDISRFRGVLFHQAFFLGIAPIAMFLAVNSYPFQPQWSLTLLSLILILASGSAFLYVVIGMNRDELLSRVSGTEREWFSFNWEFFSPALVGLLPVLFVILSQLPGVGDPIVNFLGQLVRGLQLR